MKRFRFDILARANGALGVRSRSVVELEGLDIEEARLKLYDVYEHIHTIEEKEIPVEGAVTQSFPPSSYP